MAGETPGRDLESLRADLLYDPRNRETAFHLGRTYDRLDRPEDALRAYHHQVELGGEGDEIFIAKLQIAKASHKLKRPWPEVQQAFLDAHRYDPKRAEPLYYIAEHYYSCEDHAMVYLFGTRAMALRKPGGALLVENDIYDWKAANLVAIAGYYLAQRLNDGDVFSMSAQAAQKVVKENPGDEHMRRNLSFYSKAAVEMFAGFHSKQIDFKPEAPYRASNPSVWYDGKCWRSIIRTINYHVINDRFEPIGDTCFYTRNFMAELSDDLDIKRIVPMKDLDETPRSNHRVHGFEDCRLFGHDGKLFCMSTVSDFSESGTPQIALLTLDDDYSIVRAHPLRGPWSNLCQKNWVPLVRDGKVFIIYSTSPTAVFVLGEDDQIDTNGATDFGHGRLRGGSQAIRVPDGWLFLVHDVIWMPSRLYLHRFVLMSDDFKISKMSDHFYFQNRGIEYCCGLAYDGKKLVASYSVNESAAYFGFFDLADVMAKMKSDFVI